MIKHPREMEEEDAAGSDDEEQEEETGINDNRPPLTLKHWISHRCGSSLTWGACEMPSSALVGLVVFLRILQF